MACLPRISLVLGLVSMAAVATAQDVTPASANPPPTADATTPSPANPAAANPIVTTPPATTKAPSASDSTTRTRRRAISGELAATLAVGMPKYDPPKPVEKKLEDEELPDMRDVDRPRNEIIRLPKVIVEGNKPPIFTDKDIMTRKAYAQWLAKQYYSESYLAFAKAIGYTPLRFFLPSAEASAMEQHYAEERLQGMGVMSDAAATAARLGDKAESDYIKRTSNETYMSRSDFGWHNPNK